MSVPTIVVTCCGQDYVLDRFQDRWSFGYPAMKRDEYLRSTRDNGKDHDDSPSRWTLECVTCGLAVTYKAEKITPLLDEVNERVKDARGDTRISLTFLRQLGAAR